MLDVCMLGCGGTQPLAARRLASALVRFGGSLLLLDCGEGTQIGVRECGWGMRNLNVLLLTHMHADHVLGVPGLLLTLAFTGKGETEPLTICGPEPLIEVLRGLLVVAPHLPYPLEFVVLAGGERFSLDAAPGLTIECVAVEHDVPCVAYAISVPRARRFDAARAAALAVPRTAWRVLQSGMDTEVDGRVILAADVLGPPRRGLRMVYVTDARATASLAAFVAGGGEGSDLLIADAMYATADDRPKRWESMHMTFAEAALTAREGGARRLWLTHFGPALIDPAARVAEATCIFDAAEVGFDGKVISLMFGDEP